MNEIVGLIFAKDLILVNPDDELPLSTGKQMSITHCQFSLFMEEKLFESSQMQNWKKF
jgi:hypothetical protein